MSANQSPEYKLAQSLVWSTKAFSLTEFVEKYPLPQVILVAEGYSSGDERTTFSSDQILTLHFVRKTTKIVCQTRHGNAILVDTSCPLKAEVIPMDCHESVVNAYKLSTTYKKVRYVRVLDNCSNLNKSAEESLTYNDILHIKKSDGATLQCRNVATAQAVSIPTGSDVAFVPLVDPYKYTLTEIRKKFKLPAKIRFTDKNEEKRLRNKPGRQLPPKESSLLCDMDQMTAIEEIQDSDVIVTTVCSNPEETTCLPVPITLEIQVTVAEGFLQGDDTYQKVVRTLDKQFNRTNLKDFDDFGIYEHASAIKETMNELGAEIAVAKASPKIAEHARERLQSVERQKSKKLLPFEAPPKLQPRKQNSTNEMKEPPPRPPKPGRQKSVEMKSKVLNSWNKLRSLTGKHSGDNSPGTLRGSSTSEDEYELPFDDYASISEIGERPTYEEKGIYTELESGYTDLTRNYPEASAKPYQALLARRTQGKEKEATIQPSRIQNQPLPPTPHSNPPPLPNSKPPPLPRSPPPQTKEDKHAIYEAISRYPKDLTGLSVADVTKLLKYLGMKNYVDTFENELIDGKMLTALDEDSLQFLNVLPFHCKKLMEFIRGWRPNVS